MSFAFCLHVLTTLVVAARIYTRATGRAGKLGLDDGLVIIAWVPHYHREQILIRFLTLFRSLVLLLQCSQYLVCEAPILLLN
jgi:hypothetical protein